MVKKITLVITLFLGIFLIGCFEKENKEQLFEEVYNLIIIPEEVTEDINLLESVAAGDSIANISWQSSDENIISNDGKIGNGLGQKEVQLKATVSIDNEQKEYTFNLKVELTLKIYNITYLFEGGSCEGLVTSFTDPKDVVLKTPTKEGYEFLGWYEYGKLVDKIEAKNYVLTAKWQEVARPTLTVTKDEETLYVDYGTELAIDGYDDLTLFDITASKPNIVVIDSDGFLTAKNPGVVLITCSLKTNKNIYGTIEITVLPKTPSLFLETSHVIVGKEFVIKDINYDSFDGFDIIFDENMVSYDHGFKALKVGNTKIKVAFKDFPEIYDEIDITIYDVIPVISVSNNELEVGSKSRIDIANYNNDEVIITSDDNSKVTFENNLFTVLDAGNVTIKVSLASDSSIYSTLEIKVLPLQPVLKLASENILVGGKTRLIIDNLKALDYKNLEDYKISLDTALMGPCNVDDDFYIYGLSLGQAKITVSAKNNPDISSSITINVVKTSTKLDSDGLISEGPLVLQIENFDGYIHAGEMLYVTIDGVTSPEKYKWITSNDTILNVFEDGRMICIKEGAAYVTCINPKNKEVMGSLYINVYGTPNVNYIDRLIKIAESQLGYREGPNNDTKYGDWYGLPNEPWCAMFVSWCAYQAGIGTDVILKYCGCRAGMNWFVENNRFGYKESYTPKAGDIIFFLSNGASHTGIVINCDGNRVYTIEGNTSNMCAKRSYALDHNTITGYGIPNYPKFEGEVSGGDTGGSTDGGNASTT